MVDSTPYILGQLLTKMDQQTEVMKDQVAATLASAIIASSEKKYTLTQVMEIMRDVQFARHPSPGHAAYDEWAQTKEARLNKVYG